LGALGDRFGRARLVTLSVLIYSICTGLTALSRTPMEFALLRLLTGILGLAAPAQHRRPN
jgi:MFS family permease